MKSVEKNFIPSTNPNWGRELPDGYNNSLVDKAGNNWDNGYNFDEKDDDYNRKITYDDLAKEVPFASEQKYNKPRLNREICKPSIREYSNNGEKITVEGDKVQFEDGRTIKQKIGANFINGFTFGGYLSSFDGSFSDEKIGIESGLGDVVDAKIGNIDEAYSILEAKIKDKDNPDVKELSQAVLETVEEYFGDLSNTNQRANFYYSEDFDESENNKISNLKGKNAAMCVERAALSQNLLKSLGINSVFKTSGIVKDGENDVHSYNLIEDDDKYYIFDSAIPNTVDGKASPLVASINKDYFEAISAPLSDIGASVKVSHYNPYREKNVTIEYDSNRNQRVELEPVQ